MSRVTIGKIAVEYNNATFGERQKTKDIEIVPRKIVEEIIALCEKESKADDLTLEAMRQSKYIGNKAAELLKSFEEGEDE